MTERCEKVLTANDLGITGAHQSGISIPKQQEFLSFFPNLDVNEVNPRSSFRVRERESEDVWDFNFIYYNGKKHGTSTRDEYRLTGTQKYLENIGADVGDVLVFEREAAENATYISLSRAETATGVENNVGDQVITLSGSWRVVIRL